MHGYRSFKCSYVTDRWYNLLPIEWDAGKDKIHIVLILVVGWYHNNAIMQFILLFRIDKKTLHYNCTSLMMFLPLNYVKLPIQVISL